MGQKKGVAAKKSAKDAKKDIEDKTFGQKNKKNTGTIKKQLQKLEISASLERKKKKDQEAKKERPVLNLVQQKAPIGMDPKTIPCVYFQKKMCTKGDRCKYGHRVQKSVVEDKVFRDYGKRVCPFLVEAINKNEYNKNWTCPDFHCRNVHRLKEVEKGVDVGLEEYLELTRQSLGEELTPMTEEVFLKWRARKQKEDDKHRGRAERLGKGLDMFSTKPEIFQDDEDGDFIDYTNRCEEESTEKEDSST